MRIPLPKKVADTTIDNILHQIYTAFSAGNRKFDFDFTKVEYISNQELLIISGLLKLFISSGIDFKVIFFNPGVAPNEVNPRIKRQIVQIWRVWNIWKIVPSDSYEKYFGLDGNSIERLQRDLNYYPKLSEIYDRHGVTPFVVLDPLNNYDDTDIPGIIAPVYRLNHAIEELLRINKCSHPFASNSLSTIVTEELYNNFLDHSQESSFQDLGRHAFMSISFQPKSEKEPAEAQVEKRLNFSTESLPEAKEFFFNSAKSEYRNRPYIQFSFLDFGQGIVNTLREHFFQRFKGQYSDSDILRYAFNHNSSRHPIFNVDGKEDNLIPRGLFDVLTIARRYGGLLVVRSNLGKILFDFTITKDIKLAFRRFGDTKCYFPGTLLSLYIPAIEDDRELDMSVIKPEVVFSKTKPRTKRYLLLTDIIQRIEKGKDGIYNRLIKELRSELAQKENTLTFLSFRDCDLEHRIVKKTIYFLLSDYSINIWNSVVIMNGPSSDLIREVASEIDALNVAVKNYKIHPLPIIEVDRSSEDIKVTWLGIYDNSDREKLNDLLYQISSLRKSDFKDHSNIRGNMLEFDSRGNVISRFPSSSEIIGFFREEWDSLSSLQVEGFLAKYGCVKMDDSRSLYLCSGNYYQREYIELNNLINTKADCEKVSEFLFEKLQRKVNGLSPFGFIGITQKGHKILDALVAKGLIQTSNCLYFDNYLSLEREIDDENGFTGRKFILVCDVIATGFLSVRVNTLLKAVGASLECIAVIVSTLDKEFERTKQWMAEFGEKLVTLHNWPIRKYERKDIRDEILNKNIIRINPFTNIPVVLSVEQTLFRDSVLFHSSVNFSDVNGKIEIHNEFLENIEADAIKMGFLEFNSLIHPYFFDMHLVVPHLKEELLRTIFEAIGKRVLRENDVKLFYPRKSGIGSFQFETLKKILGNYRIEEIEIERFTTSEGWKFPHNADYLNARIEDDVCLILDDGSCSGDSLIQMVDEIALYSVKEIILVCLIGRVSDHRREFFSRINTIKTRNGRSIEISIYFASHWHIPTYYIDENPLTREQRWLDEVIELQNTPQSIKAIASSIRNEIRPRRLDAFRDYKYLPKERSSGVPPKRDILVMREEIGKVIGYRLYKESFTFFDFFIRKYERTPIGKDWFKEIELLCAVFIYEPYLYDRIVGVLPDIVQRIEDFVKRLIFPGREKKLELTYSWRKNDIIHLFFIVFKGERLLDVLQTQKEFGHLIYFTEPQTKSLDYVLYKLLNYFAIDATELVHKKFDGAIMNLLKDFQGSLGAPNKEIKKMQNFLTTLPSREDLNTQLNNLVDNYRKQKEEKLHIEKKSFNHNISRILSMIRSCVVSLEENGSIPLDQISSIQEVWFSLFSFVSPILRFTSTFEGFLAPYPYFELINKFEGGSDSLRKIIGFNEDIILPLDVTFRDVEKLKLVERNILLIQAYIETDTLFYDLISKRQTMLQDFIIGIKDVMNSTPVPCKFTGLDILTPEMSINVPEIYSDILIRKEIRTNILNHRDLNSKKIVRFEIISKSNEQIVLKVMNDRQNDSDRSGSGEGIKCLNLLASYKHFGFDYAFESSKNEFTQYFTFTTTKNGYKKN